MGQHKICDCMQHVWRTVVVVLYDVLALIFLIVHRIRLCMAGREINRFAAHLPTSPNRTPGRPISHWVSVSALAAISCNQGDGGSSCFLRVDRNVSKSRFSSP